MNSKHCPHCHCSTMVVKKGTTSSGRKRYKCKNCSKSWTTKPHPQILAKKLWDDLVWHNQNIDELSIKYGFCHRTIRKKLDLYNPPVIIPDEEDRNNNTLVIAMDVTFFKRTGGILTVINVHNDKALYCEETRGYETVWDYEKAIQTLHSYGVYPKAAVVDSKKGVFEMLEGYGILVQMCQFHQKRIVRSYIRKNPILEENRSIKDLVIILLTLVVKPLRLWFMSGEQ